MIDTKELRRLAEAAYPGPWTLQTSCSFRRIGSNGHDGNILRGVNNQYDGHPDLSSSIETLEFIAAANPSAILSLLDKIDGLVSALQMAKHVIANDGTQEQLEEVFAALESVGVKP